MSCALVIGDLPEGSDGTGTDASAGAGGVDAGQDATDAAGGAAGVAGSGGAAGAGGVAGAAGGGGAAGAAGGGGAGGSDAGCGCDCDGDNHYAVGPACNGDDCDDDDAEVFSGQTAYFSTESKHKGFDYDCSGGVDRDDDVIACSGLALTGCGSQPDGYLTQAPCGQTADWGSCKVTGVVPLQTCSNDVKQAARVVKCH